MTTQLGSTELGKLRRWDRLKLMFVPTQVENDVINWQYIHFKIYKMRKVITYVERYH